MNTGLRHDDLFRGELVRLAAGEPEECARALTGWKRDSLLSRLMDSTLVGLVSAKHHLEWLEKTWLAYPPDTYFFTIRRLEDDRLIGFIELEDARLKDGECWLAIAIGARQDWNHGYGTEALRLALRFAFDELNLHRVSLDVYEYNPRARRAYERVGFQVEGRERRVILRDGKRYDIYVMGILRPDWTAQKTHRGGGANGDQH